MGHDIYGYRLKDEDYQACYLRRNMHSQTIRLLYEALEVPEFDGGVSGTGQSKTFSLTQVNKAIRTIEMNDALSEEDKHDYLTFLRCLKTEAEDSKDKEVLAEFS